LGDRELSNLSGSKRQSLFELADLPAEVGDRFQDDVRLIHLSPHLAFDELQT